jgi:hypothetical protein
MSAAIIEPATQLLSAEPVYRLVLVFELPSSAGPIRDFGTSPGSGPTVQGVVTKLQEVANAFGAPAARPDREYGWTPGFAPGAPPGPRLRVPHVPTRRK